MIDLNEVWLASASPRRHEILTALGFVVHAVPSGVDEDEDRGNSPPELAARLALEKAAAVAPRIAAGLVIGADTVVDLDGESLGKPRDRDDAARMLRRLSGRDHLVHTGFALVERPTDRRIVRVCSTHVRFAPLGDDEIADYVATGDPMDKAGAYGIQGRGATLVERIDGDFYTVMGFPAAAFARALADLGYRLPSAMAAAG